MIRHATIVRLTPHQEPVDVDLRRGRQVVAILPAGIPWGPVDQLDLGDTLLITDGRPTVLPDGRLAVPLRDPQEPTHAGP